MNDKKDIIVVTDKEQASQIFDEMKSREVAAFNHNKGETEKILTEVRDKLHSKNRLNSIKELEDFKDLITEYISILRSKGLTIHERTHFEENKHFIDRNKEYDSNAIKSLEASLQVVKDRITKRETEELDGSPKNEKPYKSLRRVYSFILAEAYHKGHSKIKNMSKTAFKDYVTGLFKNPKMANEVYQTVRSSYKLESNFLNFYTEMKKEHSKDYDYAMKNYKNYFPENLESESK